MCRKNIKGVIIVPCSPVIFGCETVIPFADLVNVGNDLLVENSFRSACQDKLEMVRRDDPRVRFVKA